MFLTSRERGIRNIGLVQVYLLKQRRNFFNNTSQLLDCFHTQTHPNGLGSGPGWGCPLTAHLETRETSPKIQWVRNMRLPKAAPVNNQFGLEAITLAASSDFFPSGLQQDHLEWKMEKDQLHGNLPSVLNRMVPGLKELTSEEEMRPSPKQNVLGGSQREGLFQAG